MSYEERVERQSLSSGTAVWKTVFGMQDKLWDGIKPLAPWRISFLMCKALKSHVDPSMAYGTSYNGVDSQSWLIYENFPPQIQCLDNFGKK